VSRRTASAIGALICVIVAALTVPVFGDVSFKRLVPFLFLLVITTVAIRFGNLAGILGTLSAALIFSIFLFRPVLSFAVEDPAARGNLIWMLLSGIIISDLLGAYKTRGVKKRRL
jgi:K+-sensing histidine kinase KdpD